MKNWGVKVEEPGKPLRWYTNERHTQADAEALADNYNKAAERAWKERHFRADASALQFQRFKALEIQSGEPY